MSQFLSADDLWTLPNVLVLFVLVAIQGSLALGNLLYISMESRRVDTAQQKIVRRAGHGLMIGATGLWLVILALSTSHFAGALIGIDWGWLSASVGLFEAVMFVGVAALLAISAREVFHLLLVDHLEYAEAAGKRTATQSLLRIGRQSLLFGLASIVAGTALCDRLVLVAASAAFVSLGMLWLSDHVTKMLERFRDLQAAAMMMIGLIAAVAFGLAADLSGLSLFGAPAMGLSRAGFYLLAAISVIAMICLTPQRRKMVRARADAAHAGVPTTEPAHAAR